MTDNPDTSSGYNLGRKIKRLSFQIDSLVRQVVVMRNELAAPLSSESGTKSAALLSSETVAEIIRARRLRNDFFSSELFADPAWDILLYLFGAHLLEEEVSVSRLCEAANVPATTALRWIARLEEVGIVVRRNDKYDKRKVLLTLSPDSLDRMQRWHAKCVQEPQPLVKATHGI